MQYCSLPPGATHFVYFGSTHFFYVPKFLLNYPAFRQRTITFYILILLFSLHEIVLRAFCTTESNEQLAIICIIIHILAFFASFSQLLWMIEIFMQSFSLQKQFYSNPFLGFSSCCTTSHALHSCTTMQELFTETAAVFFRCQYVTFVGRRSSLIFSNGKKNLVGIQQQDRPQEITKALNACHQSSKCTKLLLVSSKSV